MKNVYKISILCIILLLSSSYLQTISGDNNYIFRTKTFSAADNHKYYHQLEMENVNWEYNQTVYVKQTLVVYKNAMDYSHDLKLFMYIDPIDEEGSSIYSNSSEYYPELVIGNNSESIGNYSIIFSITPQVNWPDMFKIFIKATWNIPPVSSNDIYGGYLVATIIMNDIRTETETVTEVSNNTITETSNVTNTVTDTSTSTEYQTETVSNINNITQYETNNVTMISTVTETLSPNNEDSGPEISTEVTLNYQLFTMFVLLPVIILNRKLK